MSGRALPPAGLRPHRYRAPLLKLLDACGEPVSAQTLYAMMRADGTRAGLSTVYRELHLLARMGCVREMRTETETVYDTSARDLLMCDSCGRVQQVGRSVVAGLAEIMDGFYLSGPVTVHGRCRRCGPTAA